MFEYAAQVVDVIDGDTVRLDVDLGFSIRQRMTLRLYGINTPEIVGASKAEGLAARQYLIGLLSASFQTATQPQAWKPVTIKTFKDKGDKYGRILALIFTGDDPIPVNDKLVSAGHAKAYFGAGEKP
jgi:micrococcal nuclease